MGKFQLFPVQASTLAPEVDHLLYFLLAVTVFFTLLIFGAIFLFVAAGLAYIYSIAPVYQTEALLQTETPKNFGSQNSPEFTKLEGIYAQPTVAQGEIEILKSNLVLGGVVQNLKLDMVAGPVLPPVLGRRYLSIGLDGG